VSPPPGPLFVLPHAPHYLWLVGLAVATPAIVLAVIGLVRGRLPVALAVPRVMLTPVFAYVIGSLFVFEKSKNVAFCSSCHQTMSPLVASLNQDNGCARVHPLWQSACAGSLQAPPRATAT